MYLKSMVDGAAKIPKNPLDRIQTRFPWVMHIQAYLLHSIGDVRSGEGQVLESTHQTLIGRWISNDDASCAKLGLCVDWS